VTLSWCEPSPDPGSPWTLASYSIADGTSPGGESALTSVDSATTSYTVQGLTNGTTYYFRVEAVPETPEPVTSSPSTSTPSSTPIARTLLIPSGIWTNEVSATPEATISVPGAPSGLRADPGDSRVTLSWTASEPAGGSPVTGYDIYLGRSQGGESESPIDQVTGTSADITWLSNGIRYYFVVRADSAAGKSDPSNEVLAVPVAAGSGGTNHGGPGSGGHHQAGSPAQPGRLGWWALAAGGGGILVIVAVILMIRRPWVRTRSPVPEPTVRVQPKAGPPGQVALHRTGSQPTITVRIDPHPGDRSILVEEARP
jgi:fibronectin type III domain protein